MPTAHCCEVRTCSIPRAPTDPWRPRNRTPRPPHTAALGVPGEQDGRGAAAKFGEQGTSKVALPQMAKTFHTIIITVFTGFCINYYRTVAFYNAACKVEFQPFTW